MQDLRKKLKRYHYESERALEEWEAIGFTGSPEIPPFPEECKGMTCGARTKSGDPCQSTDLFQNGRCRAHGGLSTGPKTLEGKRRSALNTGKTYEELIAGKREFQERYAQART